MSHATHTGGPTENTPCRAYVIRHWLTHNQEDRRVLERFAGLVDNELVRAGIGQIEGPCENGRYHLQAYVQLTRSARKTQVIPLLWKSTEWIPARGTGAQNVQYCTKIDTEGKVNRAEGTEVVRFGIINGEQGKRNDLNQIKEMLDDGESMAAVADSHFGSFVRYHRGISEYRKLKRNPNRGRPNVTVLWGESGTGKSLYCRQNFPESDSVYWLNKPNASGRNARAFWDGYDGQTVVVVDEFYGWLPYDFILRLWDYGPLRVETKGGSVPMVADTFIFTSNLPPEVWYDLESKPYHGEPMIRRLHEFANVMECDSRFLQECCEIITEVNTDEEGDETGTLVQ